MLDNKISDWVVFDFHDRIYLHFLPLSFYISIVALRSCCLHGLPSCSGALTRFSGRQTRMVVRPINMLLSRRPEHLRPILQRALSPRCRSCLLLLGLASHPPLPDRGALSGRAPPPILMFFPTGLLCPELQCALQPCCRSQCSSSRNILTWERKRKEMDRLPFAINQSIACLGRMVVLVLLPVM